MFLEDYKTTAKESDCKESGVALPRPVLHNYDVIQSDASFITPVLWILGLILYVIYLIYISDERNCEEDSKEKFNRRS